MWLDFAPDINILQNIDRSLPALEKLKIRIDTEIGQILKHNRVHFRSVKKFYILKVPYHIGYGQYDSYKFPPKFDFPFTFDQLEEFLCDMDSFESAETIYKFLKENPSIMKLSLWQNDFHMVDPFGLANILPLLEYIGINDTLRDLEKFINLVSKIKKLRVVSVKIMDWDDLKYLSSRLRLKDISIVEYYEWHAYKVQLLMA